MLPKLSDFNPPRPPFLLQAINPFDNFRAASETNKLIDDSNDSKAGKLSGWQAGKP